MRRYELTVIFPLEEAAQVAIAPFLLLVRLLPEGR